MKSLAGIAGLIGFGLGVLCVLYVSMRLGFIVCGFGVAGMGYWALANENENYNF
jgi:hypothetical protein